MVGVRVEICRYVESAFPGWVECRLTDIHGREWTFIAKVPIVSMEDLDADSAYPRPGIIGCRILERRAGPDAKEVVVVDTEVPWHIEATTGECRFEVRPEQLEEFE